MQVKSKLHAEGMPATGADIMSFKYILKLYQIIIVLNYIAFCNFDLYLMAIIRHILTCSDLWLSLVQHCHP